MRKSLSIESSEVVPYEKHNSRSFDIDSKLNDNYIGIHKDLTVKHLNIDIKPIEKTIDTSKLNDPIHNALRELQKLNWYKVYVALSFFVALSEPVLIGYEFHGIIKSLQYFVLFVSSCLFFIGFAFCVIVIESTDTIAISSVCDKIEYSITGEIVFEAFFLIIGWIFILLNSPGYASLRCFRIFRYLWFMKQLTVNDDSEDVKNSKPLSLVRACQICLEFLERLGLETFTDRSKGGLVILCMFFFVAYVVAVVSWQESTAIYKHNNVTGNACGNLLDCFLIMLRLSFYDGNGFDFLTAIINFKAKGLSVLLILYLCLSAVILLNGLIGIFSNIFLNSQPDRAKCCNCHCEEDHSGVKIHDDLNKFKPPDMVLVPETLLISLENKLAKLDKQNESILAELGVLRRRRNL